MTTTDKSVDPEVDQIKAKLQMLGIVILVAAVILPFGLPFWLSMPATGIGTVGGWYAILGPFRIDADESKLVLYSWASRTRSYIDFFMLRPDAPVFRVVFRVLACRIGNSRRGYWSGPT
jgi:hypothetical protein